MTSPRQVKEDQNADTINIITMAGTDSKQTGEVLPTLPEHITPEWLGAKLKQKVKSVENTRNIWGTASKLFYRITYEDEGDGSGRPTDICIKGVFDPKMIAAQPWTISLAQREAEFFSQIAPHVDHMIFPKGWWSGVSEKQGIAIMNDLTTEGCSFAAEVASYPVEKVKNGVEQLAGLHAKYWGQSQEDHPCRESFPCLLRLAVSICLPMVFSLEGPPELGVFALFPHHPRFRLTQLLSDRDLE